MTKHIYEMPEDELLPRTREEWEKVNTLVSFGFSMVEAEEMVRDTPKATKKTIEELLEFFK
jgi:Holliday junction resolvasome RuvABC DNA-binding subunit